MPNDQNRNVDLLVLRKTSYAETSLIVAGLSPTHGQLHFLIRGGRRIGQRGSPVADLFRVLDVAYRPGRGDLHTLHSAELVTDFAGVAADLTTYNAAGWLGRFALANTLTDAETPRFYAAICAGLGRFVGVAGQPTSRTETLVCATIVGVVLVFLDEHGLLADAPTDTPQQRRNLRALLTMGEGHAPPPDLPVAVWTRLAHWAERLLHHSDCRLPAPIPGPGA